MTWGLNPGLIGTSEAGRRIHLAGLAYQAAHPEPSDIPKPAELSPPKPPAAVAPGPPPRWSDRNLIPGRGRAIIAEAAEKHGISVAAILSARRSRNILPARFEAIYRCAAETDLSLAAIGRLFRRDHNHHRRCRDEALPPYRSGPASRDELGGGQRSAAAQGLRPATGTTRPRKAHPRDGLGLMNITPDQLRAAQARVPFAFGLAPPVRRRGRSSPRSSPLFRVRPPPGVGARPLRRRARPRINAARSLTQSPRGAHAWN